MNLANGIANPNIGQTAQSGVMGSSPKFGTLSAMRLRLPPMRVRPTGPRGVFGALRGAFYGWYLVGVASLMLTLMSLTVFQSTGTYFVALNREFGWSRTILSGGFRVLAHSERGHRPDRGLPYRPVRQPDHVRDRLYHDGRGIPAAVPAAGGRRAAGCAPIPCRRPVLPSPWASSRSAPGWAAGSP